MTISVNCTYGPDRERAIVDYLYGASDAGERSLFETHLGQCGLCHAEVGSLRGLRRTLAGWAPPAPMRALEHTSPMDAGPRIATSSAPTVGAATATALSTFPAWSKAAAAVLCVGIGLGVSNLQVHYSSAGLSVRTGWMTAPGGTPQATTATTNARAATEVWRAELAVLEQSLRADMASLRPAAVSPVTPADPTSPGSDAAAVLRQVRALIARSEQQQQRELALRIGDLLNDVQTQRRADLSRIERTIGVVQNNTGMEVMRQREMINTLAVRVSSQR